MEVGFGGTGVGCLQYLNEQVVDRSGSIENIRICSGEQYLALPDGDHAIAELGEFLGCEMFESMNGAGEEVLRLGRERAHRRRTVR
ncbi:hypothetical protein GCM10010403_46650 [Glycomyces rutgersensis]|uniref:Uncharacterized protein n=1 Tax=Glycomyces rutgersensis TaxID=58115 RepID=A0ABN3GAJ5_9ACTN